MHVRDWFKSGSPWIWLNAAAVSVSLIMVFGLLLLILVRGMGYFWPSNVKEIQYHTQAGELETVIGEQWDDELVSHSRLQQSGYKFSSDAELITRYLYKVGNRDVYGSDFRVVIEPNIESLREPAGLTVVVRREWGNFYGYLDEIKENGQVIASGERAWPVFEERLARTSELHEKIRQIEKYDIGEINYALEKLRLEQRRYEIDNELTQEKLAKLDSKRAEWNQRYEVLRTQLDELYRQVARDTFTMRIQSGATRELPFSTVVKAYQPNAMSLFEKMGLYLANVWEFVSDEPREANTEGGIFPAIFGTVFMVMLMAVLVTPLGVIAAVYLREYARQGPLTRTIRIAVNNLAGVPSIVYGVFGLGFFVYFLGGNIDQLFFPEALPAPTFGTPGIMWSSLTLALLTLPVVIVSTEEGLSRIPRSIREGSLALGATKFETLWRTVIPMSSPAIMTGLILAVARAAGEVAPLMLVGVVKLAPSMPLDGNAPFIHLERKFMHLGFHIYDVGFQSPNVEAARPLVYATSLLLVLVIIALNLVAIQIRNHLREKYRSLEG